MVRPLRVIAVVFISARLIGFVSDVQAAAAAPAQVPQAIEEAALPLDQFLDLTNLARTAAGVAPLTRNSKLEVAAAAKAHDMVANHYWAHFRPGDHKAPWDFISEAGYRYSAAGENLARGYATPQGITRAWLESPAHAANLLSPRYTDVGFASIRTWDANGEPVLLTVQMFGTP